MKNNAKTVPLVEDVLLLDKECKLYPKSYTTYEDVSFIMFKKDAQRFLYVHGNGSLFDELKGEKIEVDKKKAPCNHANRLVLNRYFDYTNPRAFGNKETTIGVGDRLGLASPGHIQIIREYKVKPILAQQSIRELNLTERNIDDVLDSAAYAVIQEGYTDGFGADGDHLKLEEDIELALNAGMSMITLDCSDYIQNKVSDYSKEELQQAYCKLDKDLQKYYEEEYLNKTFDIDGTYITFSEIDLQYNVLLYHEAINYMIYIYRQYINKVGKAIDFEISIDETKTVTKPDSHFFVANELIRQNININSLAPRFIGEFQKGIDYIGNLESFESDFRSHAMIAEYFDYKLSIHSGSDKFSAFPIIAEHTNGLFHLKTAGTNWLEAVRVLAKHDPELFRSMHEYALEYFPVAQSYYHITPNLEEISPLEEMADIDLPQYMEDENARQLWHVTYGVLLTAEDEAGNRLFKDDFFAMLDAYEDAYTASLVRHIGKHLNTLRIPELITN